MHQSNSLTHLATDTDRAAAAIETLTVIAELCLRMAIAIAVGAGLRPRRPLYDAIAAARRGARLLRTDGVQRERAAA